MVSVCSSSPCRCYCAKRCVRGSTYQAGSVAGSSGVLRRLQQHVRRDHNFFHIGFCGGSCRLSDANGFAHDRFRRSWHSAGVSTPCHHHKENTASGSCHLCRVSVDRRGHVSAGSHVDLVESFLGSDQDGYVFGNRWAVSAAGFGVANAHEHKSPTPTVD